MSALQPKAHLRGFTERMHRLLTNDLNALSGDQNNACPGGCARPALPIVAECAAVNGLIAGYLETGQTAPRPSREERTAFLNSFDTAEKALAFLNQETEKLLQAIDNLDENTLGDLVSDSPVGRPMTRFALAELPAAHMMYHDGQINYIQTLHGDDQNHWGG